MKLNEAIINIRVELQNSNIKKSGLNKFAGFSYYELSDFLPTLNKLMLNHGVNDIITITKDMAILEIKKDDESNYYNIPFVMFDTPLNKNGQPSMQHIQYLGALNTYYKRYLYLNAFGITDGEIIDAIDSSSIKMPPPSKANEQSRLSAWKDFSSICENMGVEPTTFLESNVDMEDKKAVYAEVRKWLQNEQLLRDQLVSFKNA